MIYYSYMEKMLNHFCMGSVLLMEPYFYCHKNFTLLSYFILNLENVTLKIKYLKKILLKIKINVIIVIE